MSQPSTPYQKARILVVDDEKYLREVLEFDLVKAGYEVFSAEDGKEAMLFLSEKEVDLIISDNRMPKVSGVMLLHWVRARSVEHPPFILMTAFSDIASEDALSFGAHAFLRKPAEKDELLDVVSAALVARQKKWSQAVGAYEFAQPLSLPDTRLVQIGQGGFFAEVSNDFPTCFEIVRFKLPLSEGEIEGVGQIKWVRFEKAERKLQGVGVECLYMSEPSLNLYQEHLERNKPRAYIPLGEA